MKADFPHKPAQRGCVSRHVAVHYKCGLCCWLCVRLLRPFPVIFPPSTAFGRVVCWGTTRGAVHVRGGAAH